MFSENNSGSTRPGGQWGYSLLELAASLVLLAAIAVLSLPTYQGFSPHTDTPGDRKHQPENSGEQAAGPPASEQSHTDQPVNHSEGTTRAGEEPTVEEEPHKA